MPIATTQNNVSSDNTNYIKYFGQIICKWLWIGKDYCDSSTTASTSKKMKIRLSIQYQKILNLIMKKVIILKVVIDVEENLL
jgi:hypothetical protein